jgi:hypothetical protein
MSGTNLETLHSAARDYNKERYWHLGSDNNSNVKFFLSHQPSTKKILKEPHTFLRVVKDIKQ